MSNVSSKLKHEVEEMIPTIVFFFFAFQLLALTESLMLKVYGISVFVFLTATIQALVVGKVVLIADHFPLVNRFPDKPLCHNVLWKTAIYFAGLAALRYAEHFVHYWRSAKSFSEANRMMIEKMVWPHFWAVQLWLLVLLLAFCTFRELIRALGGDRIRKMFFTEPPNLKATEAARPNPAMDKVQQSS